MSDIDQRFGEKVLRHELFGGNDVKATVILFPTVMGVSDLERGFAERLAELGYAGMVADLYGRRFTPAERAQAFSAMGALRNDRAALRELLLTVLDAAETSQVAAIGFCFGGQCALDLARSGADVAGVASFHGLFDPPGLPAQPIRAKVAAYHGWDDPMVPPQAVVALGDELSAAGCDWQIHAYGHVGHGFTNPAADGSTPGVRFDEVAAKRSWAACDAFLAELFG